MRDLFLSLQKDGIEFEKGAMLSKYSSFRIGGAAELLIFPKTADELKRVLSLTYEAGIRSFVSGNMSNVLFSDDGFRGAVITTRKMRGISRSDRKVTAEAGVSLTSFAEFCRDNRLTGAEFLYGIPGTVGGAVYMNAGAFGGSVSDILASSVRAKDGETAVLSNAEHAFSYRESVYQAGGTVISAEFLLAPGDESCIAETMSALLSKRRASQPLDRPSAGSVFKRPEGHFAGKLIEDAGLKGRRVGGAEVSEKHAGFIVNAGGATAADVKALIDIIKTTVYEKTGVTLEEEIIIQK